MKTIEITGRGELSLHPDTTEITLSTEGTYPSYDEALEKSAEETQELASLFSALGFSAEALKTLDFGIDTAYETYEENRVYKKRLLGYRFTHQRKIAFPSDNARLGKILYALAHSSVKSEFEISYTVKDKKAATDRLLACAVGDAKKKAALLTEAAGVTLGEIQNIRYAFDSIDMTIRPMRSACLKERATVSYGSAESYPMSIEPDDIRISDTVTVLWEIG